MYYQNCCILSNNCHQLLPEIVRLQSCYHRTVETNHQSKACFALFYSNSKWTADGALFILSHHLWSAWNCCCDVITFGQDIEKAATLEIFIYWVRASLTCTIGRTSRCLKWKATWPHFSCRPIVETSHGEKKFDTSTDQIENRKNLFLDFM